MTQDKTDISNENAELSDEDLEKVSGGATVIPEGANVKITGNSNAQIKGLTNNGSLTIGGD